MSVLCEAIFLQVRRFAIPLSHAGVDHVGMAVAALGLLFFGLLGRVRMSSALDVGDQAPDFSLPATTGGKISLSQFRGKKLVLIEFYGADFSPV